MDPVSLAGLGLGAASLAAQLFSGCIQCYQIMIDVVNMPKQVEPLRVRMRLEQARLLEWGDKIGLLHEILEQSSVSLRLHRSMIIDVLLQIQDLFKGCMKIDMRFGESDEQSVANSVHQDQLRTLDNSNRGQILLAKALRIVSKSAELPKRLTWAMIKQEHFSKLVSQLISYNDSIVSLLDRSTILEIHKMQIESNLMMLQLSTQIEDLRNLTQASQIRSADSTMYLSGRASAEASTSVTATSHESTAARSLALLANFKASQIALEADSHDVGIEPMQRSDFDFEYVESTRQIANYKKKSVWIEWKEYDERNPNPNWSNVIEQRIIKLVTLLAMKDKPPEFRTPDCLGYLREDDEDTPRLGVVCSAPNDKPLYQPPTSLFDLIKKGYPVTLTQRIILAREVARSLMYLHSVNWLHKGIRSDNIVFFLDSDKPHKYDAPILCGFGYARPDQPDELTENPLESLEHDIYRHPKAITKGLARSQKSWDIYSLGLVLIEIAFWRSIDMIADIDFTNKKSASSKMLKMRTSLLEPSFLANLGDKCGDKYQEVVRRCLAGGMDIGIEDPTQDESNPTVGAAMLQAFSQNIVGVLDSLNI